MKVAYNSKKRYSCSKFTKLFNMFLDSFSVKDTTRREKGKKFNHILRTRGVLGEFPYKLARASSQGPFEWDR